MTGVLTKKGNADTNTHRGKAARTPAKTATYQPGREAGDRSSLTPSDGTNQLSS